MGKRYVSKSRAAEWGTSSTADRLEYLFSPVIYRRLTPEERAEREQAHQQLPRVLESGTVDDVIAAAATVGTDSEYGRNLATALDAACARDTTPAGAPRAAG